MTKLHPQPHVALSVPVAVERIRAQNSELCAFVSTRLDQALTEYEALRDEPPRSPLHGLPYALKDLWDTEGIVTTGGSWRYRDRVPRTNSPVFEVFRDAGAILLGKTNLSDMALSPEATSFVGGAVKNPFDATRTSGGSSGGSACAVARGLIAFDWGSDFGGSIRLPSAFCGVFGMRLSSETWPVLGSFPEAPESVRFMNGQGPITPTLASMRDVLGVAAPRLRTGPERPFSLRGVAIWPPDRGNWSSFANDVRPHLERAAGDVIEADLPRTTTVRNAAMAMYAAHFDDMVEVDDLGFAAGFRAVLASLLSGGRWDRRFHPNTAQVLLLMALGRYSLFRDKRRARAGADRFRDDIGRLWDRGYLVAAPVCCFEPPRIGALQRNRHIISCTVGANLSDATALAVPFGCFPSGLPRALQLMGPPGSEKQILEVAEQLVESSANLAGPRRIQAR